MRQSVIPQPNQPWATKGNFCHNNKELSWAMRMQRQFLSSLVLVGALASLGNPIAAQSGFVLFGAKNSDLVLNYSLSKTNSGSQQVTYLLYLKSQKVATRQIQVILPDTYLKTFDTQRIELSDNETGTNFPVDDIQLDPEAMTLTITVKDPIPAGVTVTMRCRNATNPRSAGLYRLRARLLGTEPNPIYRYIGDWYVSIN